MHCESRELLGNSKRVHFKMVEESQTLFSSPEHEVLVVTPEHEVLMVSYCDRAVSVINFLTLCTL